MNQGRRRFFKSISSLSLYLGLGSPVMAAPALLGAIRKEAGEDPSFPLPVQTKYFFPAGKTPVDIREDMASWGDSRKFNRIYKDLASQGKVSLKMDSRFEKDHLVSIMYFRDHESYQEYNSKLAAERVVDLERQRVLGYRIVTEVG